MDFIQTVIVLYSNLRYDFVMCHILQTITLRYEAESQSKAVSSDSVYKHKVYNKVLILIDNSIEQIPSAVHLKT